MALPHGPVPDGGVRASNRFPVAYVIKGSGMACFSTVSFEILWTTTFEPKTLTAMELDRSGSELFVTLTHVREALKQDCDSDSDSDSNLGYLPEGMEASFSAYYAKVNVKTGVIEWMHEAVGASRGLMKMVSAPAAGAVAALFCTESEYGIEFGVLAWSVNTGARLWSRSFAETARSFEDPDCFLAYSETRTSVVAHALGIMTAYSLESGDPLWQVEVRLGLSRWDFSDQFGYILTNSDYLIVVDVDTGELVDDSIGMHTDEQVDCDGDVYVEVSDNGIGVVWAPGTLLLLFVFAESPAAASRMTYFIGKVCTHVNGVVVNSVEDVAPHLSQPGRVLFTFDRRTGCSLPGLSQRDLKTLKRHASVHGISKASFSSACSNAGVSATSFGPSDLANVVCHELAITGHQGAGVDPCDIKVSTFTVCHKNGLCFLFDSSNHKLSCVDLRSWAPVWSCDFEPERDRKTHGKFCRCLEVLSDIGLVLEGYDDGIVVARKSVSGELAWIADATPGPREGLGNMIGCFASSSQSQLVVCSDQYQGQHEYANSNYNSQVVAFHAQSGEKAWVASIKSLSVATGHGLVCSLIDRKLQAQSLAAPETNRTSEAVVEMTVVQVSENFVFTGDAEGHVAAWDISSGEKRWGTKKARVEYTPLQIEEILRQRFPRQEDGAVPPLSDFLLHEKLRRRLEQGFTDSDSDADADRNESQRLTTLALCNTSDTIFATNSTFVNAIDSNSGARRWKKTMSGGYGTIGIMQLAVIEPDGILLGVVSSGAVHAWRVSSGDFLWMTEMSSVPSCFITGGSCGLAFVGEVGDVCHGNRIREGKVFAFRASSGEKLWEREEVGEVFSLSLSEAEDVLFSGGLALLSAWEISDVKKLWSIDLGATVGPIVSLAFSNSRGGVLFYGAATGTVGALMAADGAEKIRRPFHAPNSVVGFRLLEGNLVSFSNRIHVLGVEAFFSYGLVVEEAPDKFAYKAKVAWAAYAAEVVFLLVDFCQLFAFALKQHPPPGPVKSLADKLAVLQTFGLDPKHLPEFLPSPFLFVYSVTSILVALCVALVLIVKEPLENRSWHAPDSHWSTAFGLMGIFVEVTTRSGLLPLAGILLRALKIETVNGLCVMYEDPSIECLSRVHIAYACGTCFLLPLLCFVAQRLARVDYKLKCIVVKPWAVFNQSADAVNPIERAYKNPFSKNSLTHGLLVVCIKLAFLTATLFFAGFWHNCIVASTYFLGGCVLVGIDFVDDKYFPELDRKFDPNSLGAALDVGVTWSYFCNLAVAIFLSADQDISTLRFLPATVPFAAIVGYAIRSRRGQRKDRYTYYPLQNDLQQELLDG